MTSQKRQFQHIQKPLRQRMLKIGFFDERLQLSELYIVLKRFLEKEAVDYLSWTNSDKVVEVVGGMLEIVEKEMQKRKLFAKVWMKVLIVHGVLQLVIKNCTSITENLSLYLIQQLKHCHHQLIPPSSSITVETPSFGLISRSISKIKRSISSSSSSILKIFGSAQNCPNKIDESTSQDISRKILQKSSPPSLRMNNFHSFQNKQFNKQEIHQQKNLTRRQQTSSLQKTLQTTLHEYIKYLQHLITDWSAIYLSLWPYIVRTETFKLLTPIDPKNLENQIVWKIFNYFHILSQINKKFFKLHQAIHELHVYMYGTLNFIGDDLHMLYNPLASFIMNKIRSIKWEEIVKVVSGNKDKKLLQKFKLDQNQNKRTNNSISKDSISKNKQISKNPSIKSIAKLSISVSDDVLELKKMIQELGNANEVVLYVYNGYHHYKHLQNKKRPRLFISLNDHRFDLVFQVAKMIEERENKRVMVDAKKKYDNFDQPSNRIHNINMMVVKYKTNKLQQMHNPGLTIVTSKKIQLTAQSDQDITEAKI